MLNYQRVELKCGSSWIHRFPPQYPAALTTLTIRFPPRVLANFSPNPAESVAPWNGNESNLKVCVAKAKSGET